MIQDALLLFSDAQAVTVTAASTNVLDGLVARDLSSGGYPAIRVAASVGTAFAGGTSLQVQLQGSADNSTWTTYVESFAYPTAALVAGAFLDPLYLEHRGPADAVPRYYRLNYVVVGTMTGGTINAGLVVDRVDFTAYPPGIAITN